MANKKARILYVYKILKENTDEEAGITVQSIMENLASYGIDSERKSIYDDIKKLTDYGYEITKQRIGNNTFYHLIDENRFTIAEAKMLIESIQSSKYITPTATSALISKIEGLVSHREGQELQNQVTIIGRVKTDNHDVLDNIDILHKSIMEHKKVTFKYCVYNLKKELIEKHDGELYEVSPLALILNDDYYYLVAKQNDKEKHFRVDKIKNIEITEEKAEGLDGLKREEIAKYTQKVFSMYGGKEYKVRLRCKDYLIGVIIDRFGKDIMVIPDTEGYFITTVTVALSGQFLGWVFGLGDGVQIISPDEVIDEMKSYIAKVKKQYS